MVWVKMQIPQHWRETVREFALRRAAPFSLGLREKHCFSLSPDRDLPWRLFTEHTIITRSFHTAHPPPPSPSETLARAQLHSLLSRRTPSFWLLLPTYLPSRSISRLGPGQQRWLLRVFCHKLPGPAGAPRGQSGKVAKTAQPGGSPPPLLLADGP